MTAANQLEALARSAASGDENAFNELYRQTRDRAYFVAYSVTKNEDDAMDILQESYLKAWQKLGSLENPAVVGAWLNQIVGNTAKDHVKKRRPQLFQPAEEEDDPLAWQPEKDSGYIPDAAMDTAETRRLIMGIVDDLPEDQRLCVLMHYYNDLDLGEIAASLELPYETVKSRLRYARRKISDGVQALERKGTKLYGAAPIPLLIWLLHNLAGENNDRLPYVILGGSAAAGGAAVVGVAAGLRRARRAGNRPPQNCHALLLARRRGGIPRPQHLGDGALPRPRKRPRPQSRHGRPPRPLRASRSPHRHPLERTQ